jgi:ornithine cyclodeaminase/alanine dehydrogenase-like protein (mu-crystallin family)
MELRRTDFHTAGEPFRIVTGALTAEALVPLAAVVCAERTVAPGRPRLLESVGMAWEDAIVAAAVVGLG